MGDPVEPIADLLPASERLPTTLMIVPLPPRPFSAPSEGRLVDEYLANRFPMNEGARFAYHKHRCASVDHDQAPAVTMSSCFWQFAQR